MKSSPVKCFHLNDDIKLEMARGAQDKLRFPMLVIFTDWSLNEELNKLHKRRFFPHEKWIFRKLFLVLLSELGDNISPVHGVIVSPTILEISAVVLKLVHVGRNHSLKGMPHYQELQGNWHELLVQVFRKQRIFFSEKSVETHPVILENIEVRSFLSVCLPYLWYLVLLHMSHGEVRVQPGGGGSLGDLAPHQPMLLLHKELVVGCPAQGEGLVAQSSSLIYYFLSRLHTWSSDSTPAERDGPGFSFSFATSFSLNFQFQSFIAFLSLPGCISSVLFTGVFYHLFTSIEFCNQNTLITRFLKL